VFVHASAIQDGGWLEDGQAVEFDITQAPNVRPVATQ
jgi:cold shock CspA family protein